MGQYIYMFGPGNRPELRTDPTAWTDEDGRIGSEHYDRLKRAALDGTVILAGLALDAAGPAIVIFEADTDEDAERFMLEDPFVANGLFTATLHPFSASLVRASEGPA